MRSNIINFVFGAILLLALSNASCADGYSEMYPDAFLIRQETEKCIQASESMGDLKSCAGQATRRCLDGTSDWPTPQPRACVHEVYTWEEYFLNETKKKIDWAFQWDLNASKAANTYGTAVNSAMKAHLAWSDYAYSQCRLQELPNSEKSYQERMAFPPDFCMERMYAERIFELRSLVEMTPEE